MKREKEKKKENTPTPKRKTNPRPVPTHARLRMVIVYLTSLHSPTMAVLPLASTAVSVKFLDFSAIGLSIPL